MNQPVVTPAMGKEKTLTTNYQLSVSPQDGLLTPSIHSQNQAKVATSVLGSSMEEAEKSSDELWIAFENKIKSRIAEQQSMLDSAPRELIASDISHHIEGEPSLPPPVGTHHQKFSSIDSRNPTVEAVSDSLEKGRFHRLGDPRNEDLLKPSGSIKQPVRELFTFNSTESSHLVRTNLDPTYLQPSEEGTFRPKESQVSSAMDFLSGAERPDILIAQPVETFPTTSTEQRAEEFPVSQQVKNILQMSKGQRQAVLGDSSTENVIREQV